MRFRPLSMMTLALASALAPSLATAGHDSPLYVAARQYREAVRDFERQVLRTRYIDRNDERLVDDLEDQTSRMRSAARDPHRVDRLMQEWFVTRSLHGQVEARIFHQRRYPYDPRLAGSWASVRWSLYSLARQIQRCPTAPPPVIEHPVRDPHEPVRIPHEVVRTRSEVNPYGLQTYRQPFASSSPHRSVFGDAYKRQPAFAVPTDSYNNLRRSDDPDLNRGHLITVPGTPASRHEIGQAAVGAMLTRLLD